MIYKFIILLLFSLNSFYLFSQEEKETVYLLFDVDSQEKCKVAAPDDKYQNIKKYKKNIKTDFITFTICEHIFEHIKGRHKIETSARDSLSKLNIKDIDYLFDKDNKGVLYRIENGINTFIVEEINNSKIIIYEVHLLAVWVEKSP